MQHYVQLEEIYCVSEMDLKQNFANSCCGKTKNRIYFKMVWKFKMLYLKKPLP